VSDTFDGSEVSILIREKSGLLRLHAHAGGEQPATEPFVQSERHGIIGEALAARMNIVVNNVTDRRNWPVCVPGSGAEMCVPLQALAETMGVIVISHPKANAFNPEDRSIAQAAGDVCATAIKNVQLTEELRRVVNTDTLTGVFNQRYFHVAVSQELSRAKRFNQHFCILIFDLQNFRMMNKQFGFDGGDEVLRNVAHVLTSSVRSIDTVCRYTGDCFALVLPETETASLEVVKDKIIQSLHKVATPKQGEFTSLQTIFASVSYPKDGTTELELIRHLLAELDRQKRITTGASA
jgi:diguanylate cyclase (GGDEF)-like protein